MDSQGSRSEEDKRAASLRAKMRKIPLHNGPKLEAPPSQHLKLPRFISTGAHLDGASFDGRLVNMKLGITLTNKVSLRGEPFVELTTRQANEPLARWPMFAVIGGQNGPSQVEAGSISIEARGGQGWLSLKFFAKTVMQIGSQGGFMRRFLSKAMGILGRSKNISSPVAKQISEVHLLCERTGQNTAQFSVKDPPPGWKIAS